MRLVHFEARTGASGPKWRFFGFWRRLCGHRMKLRQGVFRCGPGYRPTSDFTHTEASMSFFGYAILFMVGFLVLAIWVWSIVQIVARPDFSVLAKALWIAAVLVFPIVGTIAYLVYSAKRGPIDETKKWEDMSAEEIEAAEYRASHMTATDRSGDQRIF
jgi:hypothetical protein